MQQRGETMWIRRNHWSKYYWNRNMSFAKYNVQITGDVIFCGAKEMPAKTNHKITLYTKIVTHITTAVFVKKIAIHFFSGLPEQISSKETCLLVRCEHYTEPKLCPIQLLPCTASCPYLLHYSWLSAHSQHSWNYWFFYLYEKPLAAILCNATASCNNQVLSNISAL